MWATRIDASCAVAPINGSGARCTFTERAALSGDLDRMLAALFAGHGRAVRLSVHALAEGAVVLFPLLLVGSQLVVHPAAGLGAVHGQ